MNCMLSGHVHTVGHRVDTVLSVHRRQIDHDSRTKMNHLFLGFFMSVTALIIAQQTTMPADSKKQKTLKTVSNGFVMIVSESMLNPKNK